MTHDLEIRPATINDVPEIVAMLADDPLGATRESPDDLTPYLEAFERVARDPRQHLVMARLDGKPAGTLQLMIIHGLARRGAIRAQIESVRVHRGLRGRGLGSELIRWAIEAAREAGAGIVQLTSDASRTEAHRFYERLGFVNSHAGFKLQLGK
ncbi:MAG TPA: GNAT family N-acetyltransferase [Streptosporangiaceae bacterium]